MPPLVSSLNEFTLRVGEATVLRLFTSAGQTRSGINLKGLSHANSGHSGQSAPDILRYDPITLNRSRKSG
jgi:hypothetical protein